MQFKLHVLVTASDSIFTTGDKSIIFLKFKKSVIILFLQDQ
jgi:hypothetical protein